MLISYILTLYIPTMKNKSIYILRGFLDNWIQRKKRERLLLLCLLWTQNWPYFMAYMYMDVLHESEFSLFSFKYGKMFTQTSIFYEKVLSRYFLWDFFQSKENFWNKHFRGSNLTQIAPTSFHNKSCVVRSLYMTTGTWRCYFFLQ